LKYGRKSGDEDGSNRLQKMGIGRDGGMRLRHRHFEPSAELERKHHRSGIYRNVIDLERDKRGLDFERGDRRYHLERCDRGYEQLDDRRLHGPGVRTRLLCHW
jgi:hypothetical protein